MKMNRKMEASRHSAEIVCQHVWRHWRSVVLCTNQSVAVLPYPEQQQALGLPALQPPQFLNGECRQCDDAGPICLWRLEPQPRLGPFQTLDDPRRPAIKINIEPS